MKTYYIIRKLDTEEFLCWKERLLDKNSGYFWTKGRESASVFDHKTCKKVTLYLKRNVTLNVRKVRINSKRFQEF